MAHYSANYLYSAGKKQTWNKVDKRNSSYTEEGDFFDPFIRPDPETPGDKNNLSEFMVRNPIRNSICQGDLDLSLAVGSWQSDIDRLLDKNQKADQWLFWNFPEILQ